MVPIRHHRRDLGKRGIRPPKRSPGSASYSRLEQVNALEDIARRQATTPRPSATLPAQALDEIRDGKPVSSVHEHVMTVKRHSDADESWTGSPRKRSSGSSSRGRGAEVNGPPTPETIDPRVRPHLDRHGRLVGKVRRSRRGSPLTDEEWALFERVLAETTTFHAAARSAREKARSRGAMSEDAAHLHVV